jgi:hypothetical protein
MMNLEGDNGFRRHYIDGYTKLHNEFHWNEQPTNGIQLDLVYSKQGLTMSFKKTRKLDKIRV